MAKLKVANKVINSLQDGDNVLTDQSQIAEHVVNYYKNLFGSNTVLQDLSLAEDVIPHLITE
ncbi:hypothetical protein A2U01_0066035, partial [Trifolium medium]|nr:hypothetical protein [Trifolium medium]